MFPPLSLVIFWKRLMCRQQYLACTDRNRVGEGMRAVIGLTGIFLVLASSASFGLDQRFLVLPQSFKDAEILRVFQGKDGRVVFNYRYKESSETLYDFYDTVTQKRLSPGTERLLGTDIALGQKIASDNGLSLVTTSFENSFSAFGRTFYNRAFAGAPCLWPYASTWDITDQGVTRSYFLLKKLARPVMEKSEAGCEDSERSYNLTMRYSELSMFVRVVGGTSYLFFHGEPILVRVDMLHPGAFVLGHPDIVLVPAEIIEPGSERAYSGKMKPQNALDQTDQAIEAFLAKTGG